MPQLCSLTVGHTYHRRWPAVPTWSSSGPVEGRGLQRLDHYPSHCKPHSSGHCVMEGECMLLKTATFYTLHPPFSKLLLFPHSLHFTLFPPSFLPLASFPSSSPPSLSPPSLSPPSPLPPSPLPPSPLPPLPSLPLPSLPLPSLPLPSLLSLPSSYPFLPLPLPLPSSTSPPYIPPSPPSIELISITLLPSKLPLHLPHTLQVALTWRLQALPVAACRVMPEPTSHGSVCNGLWGIWGIWGYGDMEIWGYGDMGIWGYGDMGDMGIWGYGDMGIWGYGDMGIWGYGGYGDMGLWGIWGIWGRGAHWKLQIAGILDKLVQNSDGLFSSKGVKVVEPSLTTEHTHIMYITHTRNTHTHTHTHTQTHTHTHITHIHTTNDHTLIVQDAPAYQRMLQ